MSAAIPFSISRESSASLTGQVVAGFRVALESGCWAPGDFLPSLAEISRGLGVSMITSRRAMKALADEGLVVPRASRGFEVAGAKCAAGQWRGRVLFVVPDRGDSFQVSVAGAVLGRRLCAAGYLFSQITVCRGPDGAYDMAQLRMLLKDKDLFVVQMFAVPEIAREVASSGCRSAVVARDSDDGYYGASLIRFDSLAAVPAFVERCRAAGVKRVLQATFERGFADASRALRNAGIGVTEKRLGAGNSGDGVIESVKRASMSLFSRLASEGALDADLVYFADDHAAEAGLSALALAGVRVPEDVKVVSWSNKGLGPVYSKSVARMEMDGAENGARIADFVLEALSKPGAAPEPPVLAAVWRDGDTFPFPRKNTKKPKGDERWKS